jgi:hypothetical protein
LRDGQQTVLWFEHDLYDQLQLLDVLTLASATAGALELIVVGSFPGQPSFRGLGELTADQLETLWPAVGRGSGRLVQTRGGDQLPPAPPLGGADAFATLTLRLTHAGERSSSARQTA